MEAAFLPPLGARARSSRFARLRLLLALLAASAFVGTLFFAWLWLQALEEQRSYQSAAICTANDQQPCRLRSDADVVGIRFVAGKRYSVTVRLPSGGTYVGALPREAVQALAPGDRVQVETWKGVVTMLNGRETWSSPNWGVTISQLVFLWAAVLGLALAGLAVSYMFWRRRRNV